MNGLSGISIVKLPIVGPRNRGKVGNFGLTLSQTDLHEYPALLIFVKICGYLAIFTIYFIDSLIYLISFKDGGIVHTSDGNESALLFLILTRKLYSMCYNTSILWLNTVAVKLTNRAE